MNEKERNVTLGDMKLKQEPKYIGCRFYKKNECSILKKLYCKIEPDKACSWYKQKFPCEE